MTMDITSTTIPDSTQINADDLLGHSITVTVESVSAGTTEQPVNINLVETPGRAYRPGKSMRRVLLAAWGPEASAYVGRKMTLFCEPSIRFGKDAVGGVRISHLSHIEKRLPLMLTVSRGKRAPFTVEPLVEAAPSRTEPANPNADLLAEIGALADKLPGGRKAVAVSWSESHEGQSLRDATDLGGLELLRDDLANSSELPS